MEARGAKCPRVQGLSTAKNHCLRLRACLVGKVLVLQAEVPSPVSRTQTRMLDVVHTCNPSAEEAETRRVLRTDGQPVQPDQ